MLKVLTRYMKGLSSIIKASDMLTTRLLNAFHGFHAVSSYIGLSHLLLEHQSVLCADCQITETFTLLFT